MNSLLTQKEMALPEKGEYLIIKKDLIANSKNLKNKIFRVKSVATYLKDAEETVIVLESKEIRNTSIKTSYYSINRDKFLDLELYSKIKNTNLFKNLFT